MSAWEFCTVGFSVKELREAGILSWKFRVADFYGAVRTAVCFVCHIISCFFFIIKGKADIFSNRVLLRALPASWAEELQDVFDSCGFITVVFLLLDIARVVLVFCKALW